MNIFNTPPSPCICIHPCEEANSHLFNPTPLFFSWILECRGSKAAARDVMGGAWGCGRSPYGNSKGSKLVIRRSKGSKLPGCNFHPQIYDLASRGLYSIETTPLTAPPKGYCKSPPSNPQCHHAPSHTHTSILHTHALTDLSFPFFWSAVHVMLWFPWNNPAVFHSAIVFLWSHQRHQCSVHTGQPFLFKNWLLFVH